MYELSLELFLHNGEAFDDTIEIQDNSLNCIESNILNFVHTYFDEGFRECDPRYYTLSGVDYNHLCLGKDVRLNGVLCARLEKEQQNEKVYN